MYYNIFLYNINQLFQSSPSKIDVFFCLATFTIILTLKVKIIEVTKHRRCNYMAKYTVNLKTSNH